MPNPISIGKDGIKIKPEQMGKEKIYHCIFNNKVMLFYKDEQDVLNCYEIEEEDIVNKVKSANCDNIEKLLEEYIDKKRLNIK